MGLPPSLSAVEPLLQSGESADILLGILTYNDHGTAPTLVRALVESCAKAFPDRRVLVVNCDGGSQDETPRLIQEAVPSSVPVWTVRHPIVGSWHPPLSESGVPGRESAVQSLVYLTEPVRASACLVVDGNLKSDVSQWPQYLAHPILEKGMDCVLPHFRRHRYEGTLTNTLLAPLTTALYGKRCPYHLGGAYAFSGELARTRMSALPWDEEIAQFGIDGWLTTAAMAEDMHVCQASLGPRIQPPKSPSDLSLVVAQAVGCIFHLMERYEEAWERAGKSVAIPIVGAPVELGGEIGTIRTERLADGFRQGLRDLLPVWQLVLAGDTLERILELGAEDRETFRFPASLWVQAIYDFALAYHDRLLHREHLLKALTPLYLGYTASFIMDTRTQTVEQVAQEFARLTDRFESMKPYLTQRWRWKDG